MIGPRIMPITPVAKQNAEFPAITRESWLRRRDVRRNDGAAFSRDTYAIDMLEFACKGYGHEQTVTRAQRAVYRSEFDADEVARQQVARVLDLELEIRIATEIFNADATHWYSSTSALYTDVSTDWDNAAATIISDVEGAKQKVRENCGMEPNTLVISDAHLKSLKLNTELKAYYFQGAPVLTETLLFQNLPLILGIRNVLIGTAVYNSASEGETLSVSKVWNDDYCWIGVVPAGALPIDPGVGRTLVWSEFGDGSGYEWQNYTEPQTKTDLWQAEHWTDEKVFDTYFGHLLKIDT